jgi:hypothetical protein
MFQKHKAKVAEHKYETALATWEHQVEAVTTFINTAQTFKGINTDEVMLKPGELLFFKVTGAGLVGQKRGAGHYEGKSSGISVPVGHIGHSTVRYHVGQQKGHYVQGATYEAAVDVGTVFVTNKRVIFEGSKQTRECSFDKLIGVQSDQQKGQTTLAVSNRQTPTTIHYGVDVLPAFVFRLELALANYKNTVPKLLEQLNQTKADIEAKKPVQPAIQA